MSSAYNHRRRSSKTRRNKTAAAINFYVSQRKTEKEVLPPLYGGRLFNS